MNNKLELISNGKSGYSIIRGALASASEIRAAGELQDYLEKIGGVRLPVKTDAAEPAECEILVGRTGREQPGEIDRDALGDDGFVIKTDGRGRLMIAGGERRGTLYGVYAFLEDFLGCRFYTEDCEKIPRLSDVILEPVPHVCRKPVFAVRNVFWYDYFKPEISAKRKVNGAGGREGMPEELGGVADVWGGSACHTLWSLAGWPQHEFGKEPCLSDEAVRRTILANLKKLLAARPGVDYVSVSQNDGCSSGCRCVSCMEKYNQMGTWSAVYLDFVNWVAREIRDEYPDVRIHTFAYQFTREAPVIDIRPEKNVIVQLCTIEADFKLPLDEYRERTPDELYRPENDFALLLRKWGKLCPELMVWDYTTNFCDYNVPFPNFGALRKNARLFAECHVANLFEQGNYQSVNGEFGELRSYVLAKLLWDPYMSEEEYRGHIAEFLTDFYGEGGTYIAEYMEKTEKAVTPGRDSLADFFCREITVHDAGTCPAEVTSETVLRWDAADWSGFLNYYTDIEVFDCIRDGERLFERAYAAAADETQRKRIRKSSIQLEYIRVFALAEKIKRAKQGIRGIVSHVMAENGALFTPEQAEALPGVIADKAAAVMEEQLVGKNRRLFDAMTAAGITKVTEWRPALGEKEPNFRSAPAEWFV